MSNMELYKIFTIVAEEQNLTKASEKLNISQPAVTKHIKNLENELNTVLFQRSHGMQLTKQGELLYNKIAVHIKAIEDAEKFFENNRPINLGTYATMLIRVLNESIAIFNNKNKDVEINVFTDQFNTIYERFLKYELDIIVIIKRHEKTPSNVKYIKLNSFQFFLVVNQNSDLCNKKVTIDDLKNKVVYVPRGRSEAVCHFIELLNKNGISVNSIDSVTMESIIEKNNNCVGFANSEYFKNSLKDNRIVKVDIDLDIPEMEYGIYYHYDSKNTALMHFIKIIENNLKKYN